MKRRTFLKACISYLPVTFGLSNLTACISSSSDPISPADPFSPPGPISPTDPVSPSVCQSASYSKGLSFASVDTLAKIADLDGKAFGYVQAANLPSASIVQSLPSYFDLTDSTLMNQYGWNSEFVPMPGDQGGQPSCVAWAVGYAMGSFLSARSAFGTAQTPNSQVSPADLYTKVFNRNVFSYCGTGTLIRDALNVMVDEGVASLATVPYSDAYCSLPSSNAQFFIDGYSIVESSDLMAIKAALNSFEMLPIGMDVYPDFENVNSGSVYVHPANDVSCSLDGHCMVLVGYDDARSAYRVMNSWGSRWGDDGYVWIEYDTFSRIVSEVYIPYKHQLLEPNFIIDSPDSISGSIQATRAYTRPIFVPEINQTVSFITSFLLNDAIALSNYNFSYQPEGSSQPINLGGKLVNQVVKGSRFQFDISEDSFLRGTNGVFLLELSGTSRYSEPIYLKIRTPYVTR